MKILGIDCGTAITGWAVLDTGGLKKNTKLKAPKLISCGTIETSKYSPEEHRLLDLGTSIKQLIAEFQPTEIAIEDIFFFKNATTVIKVSQARGVVMYEATKAGLKHNSYTPPQVKQMITGYGKADKKQMIFMVNKILKLKGELTQDDAADAVAIAYCHYLNAKDGKN